MFGFQVPSQDKYISIRVGQDNRANLTITLSRKTNQTSEVVFSYSRAQVLKNFLTLKNMFAVIMDVAQSWFTDSAKLPQWCFLVLRTYILWARTRRCSLSWWALSAQVCINANPENEVKIKSQFISVTEYLTPDTPDLLDIRLAWQSLGYNDQAFPQ